MNEVKQLFKIEESIYTVYEKIAENDLTEEELKGYYTLLKILGYKKEQCIQNLDNKKVSQISMTLVKTLEKITANTEISFVDFLYYPANEEKEKICLETLAREMLIENAKRKKESLDDTIASYYANEYFNKKAEYYYDCMYFKNLCDFYDEKKTEIYNKDLKYLKTIYGYLINPSIYKALIEKNNFEDITLEDMHKIQTEDRNKVQPLTDTILFDLLEDEVEEIENLVESLQENQPDIDDLECSFLENDEEECMNQKEIFLDGTVKEIEPERIKSLEEDPILANIHFTITQGILPYFLKIQTKQYTGTNEFCAYICFNYIKTYTQMDFDEINRKQMIRKTARKQQNYDNKKYKMSRDLIDSICENAKEYKKENNS